MGLAVIVLLHYRASPEWEPKGFMLCEPTKRGMTTNIIFLVTCKWCQEMPLFIKLLAIKIERMRNE